jgi:hypothetical protein
MSDEHSGHRLDIVAECDNAPSKIELAFSFVDGRTATGIATLSMGSEPVVVKLPFSCLANNLVQFHSQLCELRKSLKGSAELVNWSETFQLRMSCVNPGRGLVAIDGKITCGAAGVSELALDQSPWAAEFQFQGLLTDQTFLPEIIATLESVFATPGIDWKSPWEKRSD